MSVQRPETVWEGVLNAIAIADTRQMRLIMALMNFSYPLQLFARRDDPLYAAFINSIPLEYGLYIWIALFWLNGVALFIGLSGRYNAFTLLAEGALGLAIWGWAVIVLSVAQHSGHATAPALLAILIITWRYPTHWMRWGSRDADD